MILIRLTIAQLDVSKLSYFDMEFQIFIHLVNIVEYICNNSGNNTLHVTVTQYTLKKITFNIKLYNKNIYYIVQCVCLIWKKKICSIVRKKNILWFVSFIFFCMLIIYCILICNVQYYIYSCRGCRGRDHKVDGFTTFFLYPSIFFTQSRSSVHKTHFHNALQLNQTSSLCRSPVGPTRNKNCLWWPCLLTDWDEISNLYKEPSIGASYPVSIHLSKRFKRKRFKCEKLTDERWMLSDGKSSQNVIRFLPPWCGFYH